MNSFLLKQKGVRSVCVCTQRNGLEKDIHQSVNTGCGERPCRIVYFFFACVYFLMASENNAGELFANKERKRLCSGKKQ